MVALPAMMDLPSEWLSVALPRPAEDCYRLFAAVERIPEWLRVIRSAVVSRRDLAGRPERVSFLARLIGATIGYTLEYRHHDADRKVSWQTPAESTIRISGFSQFQTLTRASCLMTYVLEVDLGDTGLPTFDDPMFASHAASATMGDFRDWVIRTLDPSL